MDSAKPGDPFSQEEKLGGSSHEICLDVIQSHSSDVEIDIPPTIPSGTENYSMTDAIALSCHDGTPSRERTMSQLPQSNPWRSNPFTWDMDRDSLSFVSERKYNPIVIFMLILFIPPLAIATKDTEGAEGVTFFYLYGSITSLIMCMRMLWSYVKIKRSGKNDVSVSSPPAILLLSSLACDALFALISILDALSNKDGNECIFYSFGAQFSLFGSMTYFALLSVDLLMSVEFSFMNHDKFLPWYHKIALSCSLLSSILLVAADYAGESVFKRCWVKATSNPEEINITSWALINGPFAVYCFIALLTLLLGYYRANIADSKFHSASTKNMEDKPGRDKLVSQLKDILKTQALQTFTIGVHYVSICCFYYSLYNHKFDVDWRMKFFSSLITMKAIPVIIVWEWRFHSSESDKQTLEDYTLLRLAESRRLDIMQTCSSCIMETAEMSAGPQYTVAGMAKENDFESVLLLNIRGQQSGVRFRFKSYAMRVFRHIRESCGITTECYTNSFQPAKGMRERFSEGKSGSFLYFTQDSKFIVKTMTWEEKNTLIEILPLYYKHVLANPESLVVRYLGLHSMTIYGQTAYLVVMRNILPSSKLRRYDLKGSTVDRYDSEVPEKTDLKTSFTSFSQTILNLKTEAPKGTLKDGDFVKIEGNLKFAPGQREKFIDTLKSDIQFLQGIGVMDYSLLVGIGDIDRAAQEQANFALSVTSIPVPDVPIGYPQNFAGIIDILQYYNLRKKSERFWKTKIQRKDGAGISCMNPDAYGNRMLEFLLKHIK